MDLPLCFCKREKIQGAYESFSNLTYQVEVGLAHDGGIRMRKSRCQRRKNVQLMDYQLRTNDI